MQATENQTAQQEVSTPVELPEWMPEPIVRFWDLINTYPIVGFLIIIAGAFIVAKVVQMIVHRGVTRLTRKTKT
ncbi:MAG: hypothetical protein V3T72_21385, partial [Thermoanaerobaculia bacterium]